VSNFLYNYFGPDVDNEGCKVIWEEGVKPDCKTHKRQASWNNNSFIKMLNIFFLDLNSQSSTVRQDTLHFPGSIKRPQASKSEHKIFTFFFSGNLFLDPDADFECG
jgi:hypothetical protein